MAQPHTTRIGPNLIGDPTMASPWGQAGGVNAVYETTFTRTADGSGSYRLPVVGPSTGSRIHSDLFSVTAPVDLTVAFYMHSSNLGSWVGSQVKGYTSGGGFLRNHSGPRGGVSQVGAWQEHVYHVHIKSDIKKIRLDIWKRDNTDEAGSHTMYVDDAYIGVGFPGFGTAPTTLNSYVSTKGTHRTKIDSLGNLEVTTDSGATYTPWFPWMMHTDGGRASSTAYLAQGWDTNIWASNNSRINQFAGMRQGFKLSEHISPIASLYNNTTDLTARLQGIIDGGNTDKVYFGYWDNENDAETEWQVPTTVTAIFKAMMNDQPIYALNGNDMMAKSYAADGMIDYTGSYYNAKVSGSTNTNLNTRSNILGMRFVQGAGAPAGIMQVNSLNDHVGDLRMSAFAGIIDGCKGLAYFSDGLAGDVAIESASWAADMPGLTNDVASCIDIIRTKHWTTWTAATTREDVLLGSRTQVTTGGSAGYLFAVNMTTSSKSMSVTLGNRPAFMNTASGAISEIITSSTGVASLSTAGVLTFTLPKIGVGSGAMCLGPIMNISTGGSTGSTATATVGVFLNAF